MSQQYDYHSPLKQECDGEGQHVWIARTSPDMAEVELHCRCGGTIRYLREATPTSER